MELKFTNMLRIKGKLTQTPVSGMVMVFTFVKEAKRMRVSGCKITEMATAMRSTKMEMYTEASL